MRNRLLVPVVLLALSLSGACKKPPTGVAPAPTQPVETAKPVPPPEPPVKEVTEPMKPEPVTSHEESMDEINSRGILKPVHFDYDKDDVRPEDRPILQANATWIKGSPKWKIRIEGHSDERGTIKYNLALGERRANAVRAYLTNLGVEASRMRIVTYGEERPMDPGHNEDAWAKNRRGEFFVEQ